jgi:hypothetical protein
MFSQKLAMILPFWARALFVLLACSSVFLLGQLRGERIAGERHLEYVSAQAARAIKINKAQTKVVIDTQVKYLDKIKTVYQKGETIEKRIPTYVTVTDNAACNVNAGFVRLYDAAWAGADPGLATGTDGEPSPIPLSIVAETDAYNATSCLAWREQALGLREFYSKLQKITNSP